MKKPLAQRIVFVTAVLCYAAGVACALGAFFYQSGTGNDPVRASLMAAVVFFVGCGVVLHVIATARLGGVLSGSGQIGDKTQGS
jgi:uncharacterized membrane protein